MRRVRSRALRFLLLVAALSACATACQAAGDPSDPMEGMNRWFFGISEGLDRHVFGPAASGFSKVPSPLRAGVRNFTRNLKEPVIFANDVLQAHPGQAATSLARLVINSTVGLGGFLDVAKKNHLPYHDNGFGTTLGRWGVGPGAYLYLPLVGPSTFRDAIGSLTDIGLNPLTYARYPDSTAVSIVTIVIGGLGERADAQQELNTIRQTSTDPYATLRSYYLQNREAQIRGGVNLETLPDFDEATPAASKPPQSEPPASPSASPPPSTQADETDLEPPF